MSKSWFLKYSFLQIIYSYKIFRTNDEWYEWPAATFNLHQIPQQRLRVADLGFAFCFGASGPRRQWSISLRITPVLFLSGQTLCVVRSDATAHSKHIAEFRIQFHPEWLRTVLINYADLYSDNAHCVETTSPTELIPGPSYSTLWLKGLSRLWN